MAKSKKNNITSIRKSKRKVKDEYYREYLPTFFDSKLENFNTKSRSINWGMGLEHEVQLFHINNKKSKNPFFDINKSNIIFDSQESTCFLTRDNDEKGPCCKMRRNICYNKDPAVENIYNKYKSPITEEEKKFLEEIPWELSGRQQKGCDPNPVLLKRIPILMPEFVTGNHKNRSIEVSSELA